MFKIEISAETKVHYSYFQRGNDDVIFWSNACTGKAEQMYIQNLYDFQTA